MSLERVEFALGDVLGGTMKSLALAAYQKGLECFYRVGPGVPDVLVGDPTRIRQVLTNLVGNAIKFTEQGEVEVSVTCQASEGRELVLGVSVRDSGIGIPPDKQDYVFGAFSQADASTTRKYGGTGLGLAISRRLVDLMGGSLALESAPSGGCDFRFTLRVGRGSDVEAASPAFGVRRALVAATNAALRSCVAGYLREGGVDVCEAADGVAITDIMQGAQVANRPFDWLIMDAGMAAPGGYALAEKLIKDWPTLDRVVMMCGANSQRSDGQKCESLKVGARLIKPFSRSDLFEALVLTLHEEHLQVAQDRLFSFEPEETTELPNSLKLLKLNVLLVEDNPVNQTVATKMLEKAGHVVTLAANGREALDCFDKERFDLIFMDVQMPVMGGIEATQAIRAREARRSWAAGGTWQSTPIVAMTAHAMQGDRERCLMAGMDDYLSKPIRPGELQAVIARVMGAIRFDGDVGGDKDAGHLDFEAGENVADLGATIDLLDGDEAALQQLIGIFFSDFERNRKSLEHAQRSNDFASLMSLSHSIKGSAGVFSATAVAVCAQRVEAAAKLSDAAAVRRELPELLRELGALAGVLRRARKTA